MAQPRATSLFHFTKSLDTLQAILCSSFHPRYSREDISWLGLKDVAYFAVPMVCFCDIPLSRVSDHVASYGSYGIGLSKEWAVRSGLNPLLYLSSASSLATGFLPAFVASITADDKMKATSLTTRHLELLLAHTKPLRGTMVVGKTSVPKDFYLENEWRYVPHRKDISMLFTDDFLRDNAKRDARNSELKDEHPLRFEPGDIRYIFVKDDADIPPLVDFMNQKLGSISVASMKTLTTRITSLAHLELDV